jgi:hypothetical protein
LAGLGRKVFNSGDILLASEVQGYLQDQAVMVFDDSATRATAIGTANFSEGMVTYTKDDDAIQVYDGSAFVGVGSDSGLIHIETQSFSAVSSQSINDVFSSTYDNYKIHVVWSGSADNDLNMRLRVAGADNSSANYDCGYWFVRTGPSTSNNSELAFTSFKIGSAQGTLLNGFLALDIANPFASTNTSYTGHQGSRSSANVAMATYGGRTTVTTSYTGFTLFPSAGTITGTATIYAYRK